MLRFRAQVKLQIPYGVAPIGEKLDLLVHLQALGVEEFKEAPLGFLIIGLDEGKAFAGGCGGFVVSSECEDALAGNHLEPPLLATLRFHVAAIDPDCQRTIGYGQGAPVPWTSFDKGHMLLTERVLKPFSQLQDMIANRDGLQGFVEREDAL